MDFDANASTLVVGNGKIPKSIIKSLVFDKIILVNPPTIGIIQPLLSRRAKHLGAEAYVIINIVEPKPLIWSLIRPDIKRVFFTGSSDVPQDCCSGEMHRMRRRPGRKYLGRTVEYIGSRVECWRMSELGNTGLIALDFAARFSSSIQLIGFNFYQGPNVNKAYEFGQKSHVRELQDTVGAELYKNFISQIVNNKPSIKFIHFVAEKAPLLRILRLPLANYAVNEYSLGE